MMTNAMQLKFRHELKFLCPERELVLMENKIKYICEPDVHADNDGIYRIRSVYFDSYDDACFYENEGGENDRYKYRIRIYNFSDKIIKLERKKSVADLKNKESCILTRNQCEAILSGMEPEGERPPLLEEFLAQRRMDLLSPKIIVDYQRTPYVHPAGNVRVTFDRRITASSEMDFFNAAIRSTPVLEDGLNILEVKYDEVLPHGILDFLNAGRDMRRTSFSKYALCRMKAPL